MGGQRDLPLLDEDDVHFPQQVQAMLDQRPVHVILATLHQPGPWTAAAAVQS
jgi:hypothetical protein